MGLFYTVFNCDKKPSEKQMLCCLLCFAAKILYFSDTGVQSLYEYK